VPLGNLPSNFVASYQTFDLKKIGGQVFQDWDKDGVKDTFEIGHNEPLAIKITDLTRGYIHDFSTNSSGNYQSYIMLPSQYKVEANSLDYLFTTTNNKTITHTNLSDSKNIDFGIYKPTTISGKIFQDLNGDGVKQPDEISLPNVDVKITDLLGEKAIITDSFGNYSLDVIPGLVNISLHSNQNTSISTSNNSQTFNLNFGENKIIPDIGFYPFPVFTYSTKVSDFDESLQQNNTISPNEDFNYLINFENSHNYVFGTTLISDYDENKVDIVSIDDSYPFTNDGDKITWKLGDLLPDEKVNLNLFVKAKSLFPAGDNFASNIISMDCLNHYCITNSTKNINQTNIKTTPNIQLTHLISDFDQTNVVSNSIEGDTSLIEKHLVGVAVSSIDMEEGLVSSQSKDTYFDILVRKTLGVKLT